MPSMFSCGPVVPLIILHLCATCWCANPGRGRTGPTNTAPHAPSSPAWAIRKIGQLGTTVLSDIHQSVGPEHNIVICPVGIWTVLVMLMESSQGKTQEEINNVVGGGRDLKQFQLAYQRLQNYISMNNNDTEFTMVNMLLSSINTPPDKKYNKLIENNYNGKVFFMDFNKPADVARTVNGWAAGATRSRITKVITDGDINNLIFLIGNGAFFKGRWKYPFNVSMTMTDQFKDETGKILGQVSMMTDNLPLQYSYSNRLSSQIVEIPYANDLVSMYVILPSQKIKFSEAMSRLRNLTMDDILSEGLELQEVELYLPRFNVVSEWTLNAILAKMGIVKAFSPDNAELNLLGPNVYVTRINHFAEIENTEEGTVASSVTTAVISLKTQKVRFHANRPFVYLIVEKRSKVVLFAGTVVNPKAFQ